MREPRVADDPPPRPSDALCRRGALRTLPAGHPQGYADCFDAFVGDFYEAVRSGALPEGTPTFADGLRAALITDAVVESSPRRSVGRRGASKAVAGSQAVAS